MPNLIMRAYFTRTLGDCIDSGDLSLTTLFGTYTLDSAITKSDFQNALFAHYYFDEIGSETIDVFVHMFQDQLSRLSEKYNALYEAKRLKSGFDVWSTRKESGSRSDTGTSSAQSDTTASGNDSDTNNGYTDDFPINKTYTPASATAYNAKNYNQRSGSSSSTGAATSSGSTSTSGSDTRTEQNEGDSERLRAYSNNYLDITESFIDAFAPCFMGIYGC